MAEQAVSDSLSGLANRAHFLDQLDAASRDITGDRLLVVYLDLDRMKQVNDALGHSAGDRLIISTARRLTAAAEPGDVVARLGGDEFAVLRRLPAGRAGVEAAAAVGDWFRNAIASPDPALPLAAHSRASVGVAVGGPRVDGHTLLTEADMAMYRAKQAGGDTVRVVTGIGEDLDGRHPGAGYGLARAISSGELRLYYQPIVDIISAQVISVEALLRWEHPRYGLLTPDAFFADAERANELPTLDGWILAQACADVAARDAELGIYAPRLLNVNLTVDTLRFTDIYRRVLDVLDATGLDPSRLCIELPESARLTVMTDVIPALRRLRDHGVGITLDDMGAGSATLRHLSVLPLTGIKIDKLFTGGMLDNRCDYAVVKLLTDLGNDLGLTVTAEGVERPEQFDALRGLGVPRAQGYLLGPPMPAAGLARLLANPTGVGGGTGWPRGVAASTGAI
jgi:diguanylate cyclase (GGDEF)-like protein